MGLRKVVGNGGIQAEGRSSRRVFRRLSQSCPHGATLLMEWVEVRLARHRPICDVSAALMLARDNRLSRECRQMRWDQHGYRVGGPCGAIGRSLRSDDARRIVAALNACHNIPTFLLEDGLVQRLVANHVSELECSLGRRLDPVAARRLASHRIATLTMTRFEE
jgi:hypothetical protein